MLSVYVTIDVDPDYVNASGDRSSLSWQCLDLMPKILEEFETRGIPLTLFLRADHQIRDMMGGFLGLYEKASELWNAASARGHELAWHPHLYRREGNSYAPLRDPAACAEQLDECGEALARSGLGLSSVRIGEAWHSAATMIKLDELGFEVDSTAVPGRKRADTLRSFDWEPTTNSPYHPSRGDYRVSGQAPLNILEVPMTTSPIQTSYDAAPIRRYLNPTFRRELFSDALRNLRSAEPAAEVQTIVVIFHPDELLDRPGNDLHDYSWEGFAANLDLLTQTLDASHSDHGFRTLRDARSA